MKSVSSISHSAVSTHRLRSLLVVLMALPLCASAQIASVEKQAATTKPAGSAPPASEYEWKSHRKAHLRIWKVDLPGTASVRIDQCRASGNGGTSGAVREIATLGAGYQFDDYVDLPASRCFLECTLAGETKRFATVFADLTGGSYMTLLVKSPGKEGAAPLVELIADVVSVSPDEDKLAQFTARNFVPGVRDLRVSIADQLTAGFAGVGGYLRLNGLPRQKYVIRTTGKDAEGNAFEWTNEGNFERFREQTLLIYPDPYGRVRPRISVDGPR